MVKACIGLESKLLTDGSKIKTDFTNKQFAALVKLAAKVN